MYLLAEAQTTIDRPVADTYDYTKNLDHFAEWFPGVVAIASKDGSAHGTVGKTYLETVAVPFRGTREIAITVVEAEPDRRLVTEGAFKPLLPRMEITFNEDDRGMCRVHWRMFSRNQALLPRVLLLPLARRVMAKRARAGMLKLKLRVEATR